MSNRQDNMNNQDEPQNVDNIAIESLLDELLNSVGPPDLKQKIIAKVKDAASHRTEHDEAVAFARQQIQEGYHLLIPPPVHAITNEDNLGLWIRRGTALVAILAASIVGVLLIPTVFDTAARKPSIAKQSTNESGGPSITSNGNERRLPTVEKERPSKSDKPVANNESLADGDKTPTQADIVDFPTNGVNASREASEIQVAPSTEIPLTQIAGKLTEREIIRVMDDQFKLLWSRIGATPEMLIKPEAWLDRACSVIVGRSPTSAERESFRTLKKEDRYVEFATKLVDSEEFSRHWSKLLAEHYLGRQLGTARNNGADENDFVEWLQQSIEKKVFVGQMEHDLFSPLVSEKSEPYAYWMAETLDASQSMQRQSPGQLAVRQPPLDMHEAGLIGIARQAMRLAGNNAMTCSQCHTSDPSDSGISSYLANASTRGSSDAFWSVTANFAGMSLEFPDKKRKLRGNSKKEYFVEDADGRMKLITAGLPTNDLVRGNQDIAQWYLRSAEPRTALVELAWGAVFKQPLVPSFGLDDNEGLSERKDLKNLLATQMQIGESDLGTLVRCMVLSKPFQLERVSTDYPWYLKATDSQIASKHKQMRLLAGFPAVDNIARVSGKAPLDRMAALFETQSSFRKSNSALAQGNVERTNSSGINNPKSSVKEFDEDQVRYLIGLANPYRKLETLADSLAKNSMSWPMLLEHAYLISDARIPNKNEREDAERIHNAVNHDRAKAVLMVIQARLGSW